MHRVAWNLRYPSSQPTRITPADNSNPWRNIPIGPLALPGTYSIDLMKLVNGELTRLAERRTFEVVPLELATFPSKDRAETLAFQRRAASLQRAVLGTVRVVGEAQSRISHLRKALLDTPATEDAQLKTIENLQADLTTLKTLLTGDRTLRKRSTGSPRSIQELANDIGGSGLRVTSAPTQTQRDTLALTEPLFAKALSDTRNLLSALKSFEAYVERSGAPWTPSRLPEWSPK